MERVYRDRAEAVLAFLGELAEVRDLGEFPKRATLGLASRLRADPAPGSEASNSKSQEYTFCGLPRVSETCGPCGVSCSETCERILRAARGGARLTSVFDRFRRRHGLA